MCSFFFVVEQMSNPKALQHIERALYYANRHADHRRHGDHRRSVSFGGQKRKHETQIKHDIIGHLVKRCDEIVTTHTLESGKGSAAAYLLKKTSDIFADEYKVEELHRPLSKGTPEQLFPTMQTRRVFDSIHTLPRLEQFMSLGISVTEITEYVTEITKYSVDVIWNEKPSVHEDDGNWQNTNVSLEYDPEDNLLDLASLFNDIPPPQAFTESVRKWNEDRKKKENSPFVSVGNVGVLFAIFLQEKFKVQKLIIDDTSVHIYKRISEYLFVLPQLPNGCIYSPQKRRIITQAHLWFPQQKYSGNLVTFEKKNGKWSKTNESNKQIIVHGSTMAMPYKYTIEMDGTIVSWYLYVFNDWNQIKNDDTSEIEDVNNFYSNKHSKDIIATSKANTPKNKITAMDVAGDVHGLEGYSDFFSLSVDVDLNDDGQEYDLSLKFRNDSDEKWVHFGCCLLYNLERDALYLSISQLKSEFDGMLAPFNKYRRSVGMLTVSHEAVIVNLAKYLQKHYGIAELKMNSTEIGMNTNIKVNSVFYATFKNRPYIYLDNGFVPTFKKQQLVSRQKMQTFFDMTLESFVKSLPDAGVFCMHMKTCDITPPNICQDTSQEDESMKPKRFINPFKQKQAQKEGNIFSKFAKLF